MSTSLQESHNELRRLVAELLTEADAQVKHARDAADTEEVYRAAKSRAGLIHSASEEKHTVFKLTALVDRDCTVERSRAKVAEALRRASSERMNALRTACSAYQSFMRTVQTEHEMTAYPTPVNFGQTNKGA